MDESKLKQITQRLQAACSEVERMMVGQSSVIRHTLAAFAAGGHVLMEDVPGTGKTTLAASVATVLGLDFARVQGTPDLLPGELTGTLVFHPAAADFQFHPGPVFTQVLLMDEINRATPRTQSALLEAMAEGHVSVDGKTYPLRMPFFVMATANPVESQGVFPLPEAQLDRFLVRLRLGYTTEQDEVAMVQRVRLQQLPVLSTALSAAELSDIQDYTAQVFVHDDVIRYIVRLCRATRVHEGLALGASPRSVLSLTAFSQALALLDGRTYVTPDDVQEAWLPVMEHRVKPHLDWRNSGMSEESMQILKEVLDSAQVPGELTPEV